MKKQLLFVTQYLQTGGIEKSLLTLLADIDYEKYDVDLLLFDYSGVLFKFIPPEVNVLPPLFETFSIPISRAIPELINKKKYRILAGKVLAPALSKFSPGIGTGMRWKVYRKVLPHQTKHYDVAISYIDFFCNYYVTEKVNAEKKIVYNHMDYTYSQKSGWPCPKLDRESFSQSDVIVTVAESAKESLASHFPEFRNKMMVIHNRVSSQTVQAMANESVDIKDDQNIRKFIIVTVARLVDEKGVLFALEACKILVEQGYDINWLIIGNGPLFNELKAKSKEWDMESHFILLGEKDNPYPYIKACDVYVQPSKTEAHCVAVEEAIALVRPILVTDIPAFRNQIASEETGVLTEVNPLGIAEGLRRYLDSSELRGKISENLSNLKERNKEELDKFNRIISL